MRLADLEPEFAAVPGTVSVWCAPLGAGPWYARAEHVPHYAASTMKVAVLLAAQHAHEAGTLDLDRPVPVTDRFASAAPGAPDYVLAHAPDDDPAPWERLGGTASLRWLAERMIVRSSNLATNIVLAHVGIGSAHREWARAGARHSRLGRGIEDAAARAAGITNEVTAADLGQPGAEPGGGEDVGQDDALRVGHLRRQGSQVVVGERDPGVLRLQSVEPARGLRAAEAGDRRRPSARASSRGPDADQFRRSRSW